MEIPASFFDVSFNKAMAFGYKTEDVDEFVTQAIQYLKDAQEENETLLEKMGVLAANLEKYREEEDSLRSALVGAQKLGDSILRDSRNKAEAIVNDATARADRVTEEAALKLAQQQQELDYLKKEVSNFKEKLFNLYRVHLDAINNIPSSIPAADQSQRPETQPQSPQQTSEQTVIDEPYDSPYVERLEQPVDGLDYSQPAPPPLQEPQAPVQPPQSSDQPVDYSQPAQDSETVSEQDTTPEIIATQYIEEIEEPEEIIEISQPDEDEFFTDDFDGFDDEDDSEESLEHNAKEIEDDYSTQVEYSRPIDTEYSDGADFPAIDAEEFDVVSVTHEVDSTQPEPLQDEVITVSAVAYEDEPEQNQEPDDTTLYTPRGTRRLGKQRRSIFEPLPMVQMEFSDSEQDDYEDNEFAEDTKRLRSVDINRIPFFDDEDEDEDILSPATDSIRKPVISKKFGELKFGEGFDMKGH